LSVTLQDKGVLIAR